MPQALSSMRIHPYTEPEGIEWEPLGKSAAELTNSTIPYAASLHTYRARVPGGWLVLVMACGSDTAMTFLPDPFHEWSGNAAIHAQHHP